MAESRKQEIAKKYIEKEVLNQDLLKLQSEFQQIEKETKDSLEGLKDIFSFKSILGSENTDNSGTENLTNSLFNKSGTEHFGSEKFINILFNEKGNLRSKIGYEFSKLKTINYYIISEEGKKNLDLLYSELQKAQSEKDLLSNLGMKLDNLQQEVSGGGNQEDNSKKIEKKIEKLDVDEKYIYQQARLYGVTDDRQIAYILATVKGECNFKNIEGVGKYLPYGKDGYYERGFVQLTHKYNYEKFTKIIKDSGLNFKDNSGNPLSKDDLDLVQNPDTVLKSNDLAAFILVYGMKNGSFTGKKLSDFINNKKTDFYNARSIINGMSSSPEKYAEHAQEYLNNLSNKENLEDEDSILVGSGSEKQVENTQESLENEGSILIGPEILAESSDQIGGLGNSIMTGFQGGYNKTYFKNMNGMEGKSTKTHPNRFNKKEDVVNWKNKHPGVKSFIMYFGANTKDNAQTLRDLEQWSKWLQEEGIQPVLCTCIGSDNNPHLNKLNPEIRELGTKLEVPVLNFADKYDKEKELFDIGKNKHPSWKGYGEMVNLIKKSAKIT